MSLCLYKPHFPVVYSLAIHRMGRLNPKNVVVLLLPFPAQGHLTPFLHFSRLLALNGLRTVFVGSATHNRQARLRLQGWDLSSFPSISFTDLPLPPFRVPDPDLSESTIKFPSHLIPAFEASGQLRDPLDLLLRSLSASCRRVVIVHDPLMSFAAELGSTHPNVEAFAYRCVGAFSSLAFQMHQDMDQVKRVKPNLDPVSPQGCFSMEFTDFMKRRHGHTSLCKGELFNTFDTMEGEFLDMLAKRPRYQNKRIWAIGPVFPIQPEKSPDPKTSSLFNWLDQHPPQSVLYVSFGSITSLSTAQIVQLAVGLEGSRQRFLWVLRDADRGDIFFHGRKTQFQLPEGFEKRVAGLGLVLRDWCPQLNVLSHGAVGGFLTHCGWNSCMESLSLGVPMATWPLHSDQPANAQLVTQVLKVGVVVREWGTDGLVVAEEIEKAVRRLMEDTPERSEIRARSAKLRDAARHATSRTGSSTAAVDSFVSLITRP